MTVKISGNSSSSTPSFAGDDGDSGLHATADQVQLVTNGTVGVTVDSSQRVGIGTAAFSAVSGISGANLQVLGGAIIGNDAASSGGSGWLAFDSATTAPTNSKPVIYHKSGVGLGLKSDYEIDFEIGADTKARINNSGVLNITSTATNGKITLGHANNYLYGDTSNNVIIGNSGSDRMTVHSTGYVNMGGFQSSNNRHRLNGINALQGTLITTISAYQTSGGTNSDTAEFFSVIYPGISPSTAATAMKVYRNSGTTRSISANGTINASGADYAEYMFKSGDFTIAKGDVCGVNAEGKLTNVFADAIGFVVKSTDPSYVGGDIWHNDVGEEPGGYNDDRTEEEIAAAKIVYEQELEAARQMVDRIAFSGQVPVNVTGTTPGQYIVPAETADGGIEGVAKNEANLTLAEYMRAVGKVIATEDDGRARIIVKVA